MPSKKVIITAVNEIILKYKRPLTLRQIYYQLVSRNIIENKLNNYKSLSKILVEAKEKNLVPEDRIEDRGRTSYGGDGGFPDPDTFMIETTWNFKNAWENFTKPMWEDQGKYLEIWIEKDALSQLAYEAAAGYRVRVCVGKGYSSYTYIRAAVDRFIPMEEKECIILYFGDFDPSGLDITRDLGRRMNDYGADFVEVRRIALLQDQIARYNLPPAPVKMSDARAAAFISRYGTGVVELDALEPPVLQEMIEEAIEDEIDKATWQEKIKEIEDERKEVYSRIFELTKDWPGGRIGGP